jgi:hypothetical protein
MKEGAPRRLEAVTEIVKEPALVGVPEMMPERRWRVTPGGSPLAEKEEGRLEGELARRI